MIKKLNGQRLCMQDIRTRMGYKNFCLINIETDFWPNITVEDWMAIVKLQKKQRRDLYHLMKMSFILVLVI